MKKLNRQLLDKNIQEVVDNDFKSNNVFGACYAVIQDGETIYKKYFGYAQLDKNPIDKNTLFRLASMTKPVTAIAILMLVDRGLLSLDDEITKFIPEYKNVRITSLEDGKLVDLGESKNAIRVRHLLSHSSGVGSSCYKKDTLLTAENKQTALSLAKFYAEKGLDYEPGTAQAYSGVGAFSVLGYIIEQVTGKSLQEFYNKEIFEPLEMFNTTFIPTKEQWKNVVAMHGRDGDKNIIVPMKENCAFVDYPCSHCLAGAGLLSTLDDYVKFSQMLLNKGKTPTKILLKEEIFSQMVTSQAPVDSTGAWGFGVSVAVEDTPLLSKGSFGWSGAYGSHFWVSPKENIVAVYMKNTNTDPGSCKSSIEFESAVRNSFE